MFPVRSCILFTKNHSSCDSVEIVVANLRKAVLIVSDTPTPRVLRPYQLEATQRVEDSWANGKSRVSVVLPTGTGKMVPHFVPVPTPSGVKPHGDLRVGDVVFHQSGNPTTITHIHPHGLSDVWRITFSDKTSVLAGEDHLWKVSRKDNDWKLMTTEDLSNTILRPNGDRALKIPMTIPVKYPERDLPIEPYTLGSLIASGALTVNRASNITIHTSDKHVHERVKRAYPKSEVRTYDVRSPIMAFTKHPEVLTAITDFGLNVRSYLRFIPTQYLESSVEQRIALLQGLMDGDGISRMGNRYAIYSTLSPKLAEDVQNLACSLGGTATITASPRARIDTEHWSTDINKHKSLYRLSILLPSDMSPWYSRRKIPYKPAVVREPNRVIVSVEYAGKEECQCITVDNPDGLYLVGNEHIVTHNSSVIANVATRARRTGKKALLLAHRTELLDQMAGAVQAVDPLGEEVGIVAAERDEHQAGIVAASFQTLSRSPNRLAALGNRDVILADECFPAGTLVGNTAIENIQVGDMVPSWDEHTGQMVRKTVTRVTESVPTDMVRILFVNGLEVACTAKHPFLTENGWLPASKLLNEHVITPHARGGSVKALRVDTLKPTDDGTFGGSCPDGLVYNLEVEGTHTYLVDGGFVAHNCHHISAATYTRVLEDMGALDPSSGVNSCGFTATMYRDDGKALGDVWSEVVFEKDLMWAIREGYLIAPHGKTIAIQGLNQLASIRSVRGDYNQTELADVMNASVDSTVDAILRHCPDAAMIVFAAGVKHAATLAGKLTAAGIPARDVTGAHKRDYREEAYSDFREGRINCLVTVQVLTEGADFPRCDTVVLARPTRSKVLLTQIIGRAVRPYTDPDGFEKDTALVLDLTGVVRDAKLTSLTDLYPEAKREVYTEDGEEVTGTDKDPTLAPPEKERKGILQLEDIDLVEGGAPFRSKVLWMKSDPLNTDGDEIAFMPLRYPRQYVFLYPPLNRVTDKGVMLGRLDANRGITFVTDPTGNIVRGNIAEAMTAAEQIVGSTGYIRKDAQWRKPSVKPSDSQKSLAKNLNIDVDPNMLNKAELSDLITLRLAKPLLADVVRRTGYPLE